MELLLKELNSIRDQVIAELKGKISDVQLAAVETKLRAEIKSSVDAIGARNVVLGVTDAEKKKFRFSKCILAQVEAKAGFDDKWWDANDAGFEREVLIATAKEAAKYRSNNASQSSAGGLLIAADFTSEIIDLAMAATPMMDLGISVYRGLRGELPIPKVTGRPTTYWLGEEDAATESATTYGEVILRPRTMGAFTKISRQLLYQTSGVAEQICREQLSMALQLGMEDGIINGTGSDKQPLGLLAMTGFTATTAIGSPYRFSFKVANNMVTNIDVANMLRPTGKFGFLTRPEVLGALKAERVPQFSNDADGAYANGAVLSVKQVEEKLGYKIRTSTLVPAAANATSVVFGDFSQVMLGLWDGLEIKASDTAGNSTGSAFTQRQIWINAFQQLDVNVKDATGLTKVTDAATNLL